jgi:hypothetical protein
MVGLQELDYLPNEQKLPPGHFEARPGSLSRTVRESSRPARAQGTLTFPLAGV